MRDRTLSRADIRMVLDERLTPPTPIKVLRKQWEQAMAADTFPRYEIEPAARGFRLTVQETPDRAREVLGESQSLNTLVVRERTHRGWPHEAADIIMKRTEKDLA